jgi:glycosyltransferase involved in cell wall biosynthesis
LSRDELHVLYSFPLRLGVTGVGTTAWQQVSSLEQLGVRVTVVCGSCERPLSGNSRVIETMRLGHWRIAYRLLGQNRAFDWHDRRAAGILRRDPCSFDVVHCWPLGSLATLTQAKALGVASVLERPNTHTAFAYEIVAQECRKLGISLPTGHDHAFNRKRLDREEAEYAVADCLACPSPFVMKTFLDRGFESEKLGRHRYGYDPSVFGDKPRRAGEFPRSTQEPNRPFVAIFVGSGDPRKGLHYALDAWLESGLAKKGEFWICGDFVPSYRDLLAERLSHPSVHVFGRTSEVQDLMSRADVLVLPSIEEGSALVTYEARACGCVLLVSDAAGAPCTHMEDGLIHTAGNVHELAQHMAMISGDHALLSRLRHRSLAGAPELTWLNAGQQVCELYRRVIAASRGGKAKAQQDAGTTAISMAPIGAANG